MHLIRPKSDWERTLERAQPANLRLRKTRITLHDCPGLPPGQVAVMGPDRPRSVIAANEMLRAIDEGDLQVDVACHPDRWDNLCTTLQLAGYIVTNADAPYTPPNEPWRTRPLPEWLM